MRYVLSLLAVAVLFTAAVGTVHAQAKQLIVRGSYEHINGVNLPWMRNNTSNYGHDIGPNHYTNYGYDYVSSDVSSYYADIKNMHANIVRVWLFENLQGLTFGSNGHITGIDPTFLNNLKDMVQQANNHGLALELTINTNSDIAQNGYPAGGGGRVVNWVTDSGARTDFLNNVVKPLARTFNNNSGVYGYDIMNECNYAVAFNYCSAASQLYSERRPGHPQHQQRHSGNMQHRRHQQLRNGQLLQPCRRRRAELLRLPQLLGQP